jgi:hypothetical protein
VNNEVFLLKLLLIIADLRFLSEESLLVLVREVGVLIEGLIKHLSVGLIKKRTLRLWLGG